MDAHFFRKLADELKELLNGARIEKIYAPALNTLSFQLFLPYEFKDQRKWKLYFRFERKEPLLFLSSIALPNPPVPPAFVMRLRKYVQDRKLGEAKINWVKRQMAFPFTASQDILSQEKNPPCWLLFDLKNGVKLLKELDEEFFTPPLFPDTAILEQLLKNSIDKTASSQQNELVSNIASWERYPVLTPALRNTMSYMDILDAKALLIDLEDTNGDIFVYRNKNITLANNPENLAQPKNIAVLSAWALEKEESKNFEQISFETCKYPCLNAVQDFSEQRLLENIGAKLGNEQAKPIKTAQKKFKKLMQKLDFEEERLLNMFAEKEKALLIKAELYRFNKEEKLPQITVQSLDNQKNIIVELNPKLTLLENMEAFFKQADRGERGLRYLIQRKELVKKEFEQSLKELENVSSQTKYVQETPEESNDSLQNSQPKTTENKLYSTFISSDGYVLLLGKSAKGNHELMRIALAHDYWLHSEIGQSAHLILRRKHGGDIVPQKSLEEAGVLVGLKSWQNTDSKANIICALAKDIKPMKKATPGTARINKVFKSFSVTLDNSLPQRLKQL
ncbi:NFACT RNA binding domain-containing protein [Desulfovibrio litoralis]|uniref:Predicted component of the ribosome quality control (RQC) complex, YloA/Tae2 family, contains fibronectin-binding (FbpA) and DUF814 domains n=1 Tax=Desulfovibrio litoralis DSM 11393 TaxID=1121455 RepID=A0A1M7SX23_9BACT|nr:NFACT RNA binding domain-containing protein [Desulfovibrio litoralis]SHN62956.1 Predicted component of the ribosome quality control (RQC) complex, YloA/Tae2 family, contains fibronectin-binding (FbpA) and DUF814 domains [Desulfovibrio litoralis DSM 11393]